MKTQEIIERLNALEADPAPVKKKSTAKNSAPAPPATDDLLTLTAARIVAALNLEQQGVTAELLVAQVKQFEFDKPYEGLVQ